MAFELALRILWAGPLAFAINFFLRPSPLPPKFSSRVGAVLWAVAWALVPIYWLRETGPYFAFFLGSLTLATGAAFWLAPAPSPGARSHLRAHLATLLLTKGALLTVALAHIPHPDFAAVDEMGRAHVNGSRDAFRDFWGGSSGGTAELFVVVAYAVWGIGFPLIFVLRRKPAPEVPAPLPRWRTLLCASLVVGESSVFYLQNVLGWKL